jgi:hypothetical protein
MEWYPSGRPTKKLSSIGSPRTRELPSPGFVFLSFFNFLEPSLVFHDASHVRFDVARIGTHKRAWIVLKSLGLSPQAIEYRPGHSARAYLPNCTRTDLLVGRAHIANNGFDIRLLDAALTLFLNSLHEVLYVSPFTA